MESTKFEKEWEKLSPENELKTSQQSCPLASGIRVIGWLNIILALIVSAAMSNSMSFSDSRSLTIIALTVGGVIGCIMCYGLAVCVEAASLWLEERRNTRNVK